MHRLLHHYYREFSSQDPSLGQFHKVIALHEQPMSWQEVHALSPHFPKAWFELAKLSSQDRIEFVKQYWIDTLPFHATLSKQLERFFNRVEEIAILLLQRHAGAPFEQEMVYILTGETGFFRASPPALPEKVAKFRACFPHFTFPQGYLQFFLIHDGFAKACDSGILSLEKVIAVYQPFMALLSGLDPLLLCDRRAIEPKKLLPFYEEVQAKGYQCFYADWYPNGEMGNLYYAKEDHTLCNFEKEDGMAFSSFFDWLCFYLQGVDDL